MIPCHSARWNEIIHALPGFDIYHTSEFHQLKNGENFIEPRLFHYQSGSHTIALPLVLRSIDAMVSGQSRGLLDAASVYGYPGPLTDCDALSPAVTTAFQDSLAETLRHLGVVSVFSRLNPFKPNQHLLDGLGRIEDVGYSVGIDLTLDEETRFAAYRHNHRDNIRRLRAQGIRVIHDAAFAHIDEFRELYYSTLARIDAASYYYFDASYFRRIAKLIKNEAYLLIGRIRDETICGGLFFCMNDVAHAHLTATSSTWLPMAPTKMLFDEAARFFRERGGRVLHLGGGVRGKADGLYHFKAGFGTLTFPFKVWKWIVDHERYKDLCGLAEGRRSISDDDYFPAYRCRDDRI